MRQFVNQCVTYQGVSQNEGWIRPELRGENASSGIYPFRKTAGQDPPS